MASPIAGLFTYARPGDNRITGATVTVQTGSADVEYPPEYLNDLRPERPAKLTTLAGAFVVDLGIAVEVQWSTFIHHNIDPTVSVRLQGNATNVWTGTPPVDLAFTMQPDYPDGFSVNPWASLMALPLATRQQRWWRLAILTSNSVPISIGEWCLLTQQRTFGVRNIKRGSTRILNRPSIAHKTEADVAKVYDIGTTWRSLSVELEATDTVLTEIEEWYRDARGMTLPSIIVPNSNEVDAWMVMFATPAREHQRLYPNMYGLTLDLEELARGLVP